MDETAGLSPAAKRTFDETLNMELALLGLTLQDVQEAFASAMHAAIIAQCVPGEDSGEPPPLGLLGGGAGPQ